MKTYPLRVSAETIESFFNNTSPTTFENDFTFTGHIVVPTPVASNEACTKSYADTKVSKTTNSNRVYGTSGTGAQTLYTVGGNSGNLVQRVTSGNISVPVTPTASTHAASKQYVDTHGAVSALTPVLVDSGLSVSSAQISGEDQDYSGFIFDTTSDYNGFYVLTYGYTINIISIYGLSLNTSYKTTATVKKSDGYFTTCVLSYGITQEGSTYHLHFYQKQNLIPTGYGGALYKIKLY